MDEQSPRPRQPYRSHPGHHPEAISQRPASGAHSLISLALRTLALILLLSQGPLVRAGEWIRPADPNAPLTWGRSDGILFGLPSIGGMGGPRGLIRIGEPDEAGTTAPYLFNFIAIEPVIAGPGPRHTRMAFSELERSVVGLFQQGRQLSSPRWQGDLITSGSEEILTVPIEVEKFDNGAHVWLEAAISSARPHEIRFTVHRHTDSAPLEELTLTATMGNKTRLHQLWLRDAVIDSHRIYAAYQGDDFIEKDEYPAHRLLRWQGRPTIFLTNDEPYPHLVHIGRRSHWSYTHRKLTQYWAVPPGQNLAGLRARVNGRRVYWRSRIEIPGGSAFENFELRSPFEPGQVFIFGITTDRPDQLISPPSGQ